MSRRWVPWRRRLRDVSDGVPDLGSLGDDPISIILGLVVLVLLLPFLLLVLVTGIELLALLVVLPLAILGRLLLGREWTVEVRRGWRPWWELRSGDWAGSRQRIYDIALAIERGDLPPRTLGEPEHRNSPGGR